MTKRNVLFAASALAVIAVVFWLLRNRSDDNTSTKQTSNTESPGDNFTPADPGERRRKPVKVDKRKFKPKTSAESPHIDTSKMSEHGAGIDRRFAQLLAMFKAEGKTPCEKSYNAIQAEKKVAKKNGKRSIFTFVAPKDEFFKICNSLPEPARKCMEPLFATRNRAHCKALRPKDAVIGKMLKIRKKKITNVDDFEKNPKKDPNY